MLWCHIVRSGAGELSADEEGELATVGVTDAKFGGPELLDATWNAVADAAPVLVTRPAPHVRVMTSDVTMAELTLNWIMPNLLLR